MKKWTFLTVLVFALAACDQGTTSAERQVNVENVGTITDLDREKRRVIIRVDGRLLTLRVSEEIESFDQLTQGDRVRFAYQEAVAVRMAFPGEAETVSSDSAGTVALASVPPDLNSSARSLFIATFLEYDPRSKQASLELADGSSLLVFVPSELRSFARARSRGDQILIESTFKRAVSIEEQ